MERGGGIKRPSEKAAKGKEKSKKPAAQKEEPAPAPNRTDGEPTYRVRFADDHVQGVHKQAEADLKDQDRDAVAPVMRSVKRMIEYLGELTAAQNYAESTYVPVTYVAKHEVPLFRVIRGEGGRRGAALTVRDPQGEIFSIPQPILGSPTRDQSLVVLSIVNYLVNRSTSKEAYPPPSVLEIKSIN